MQFQFHIYILWQSKFIKKLTLDEKKFLWMTLLLFFILKSAVINSEYNRMEKRQGAKEEAVNLQLRRKTIKKN